MDANNATGGKVSDVSRQWQGAASWRVVSAVHKRLTTIDPSSLNTFLLPFGRVSLRLSAFAWEPGRAEL
jgi:hypothetical protein